jgi:aerobic C4-dicarboxylate transport protein
MDSGLNTIASAFYAFTHVILALAPIGAFGSMAYAVGSNGVSVLLVLAWFVIAYYAVQILFVLGVLGAICLAARVDLFAILRFIKDEIWVVLGTASSESVLPRLLEKLPEYGVSRQAVGLILPTGYVFNLGGAAIYLTMATVFACNMFGVHPTLGQYASLILIMLVTSKGVATVTGGAFVTFAATATASGFVPIEALPVMFGVYRLMSPANSTGNAVGNAIATVVIAKVCGEYEPAARAVPASESKA